MAQLHDDSPTAHLHALRGAALTLRDDPFVVGDTAALHYESDALIVVRNGRIAAFGPYATLRADLPDSVPVTHHRDALIVPGFIDAHVHYPQTQIIGAGGKRLIDWLDEYTFAAEQQFADRAHACFVADIFLDACLAYGTTTASVYCTVHPQSADAFFEAADARGLRMIAGKTLMDRNAPDALLDTAQRGYDESKALIERWRGRGRLGYAITPRFAVTSTPEQLELAGALLAENPDVWCQTHISEQLDEVAWIRRLYPERIDYLDVYDHYGLLGPRTLLGHGIHLTEREWQRCHDSGTSIVHCPTSNAFLGSGLFDWSMAKRPERPVSVALATDVGGGTTLSMLATMGAAHQIAQLGGHALSATKSFHLATRGAASALRLEDRIGSIAPGMEADLVVLELGHSPLTRLRMAHCRSIDDVLFMLMTHGDDRAVRAVYVMGEKYDTGKPRDRSACGARDSARMTGRFDSSTTGAVVRRSSDRTVPAAGDERSKETVPVSIRTATTAADFAAFAALVEEYVTWSRERYQDEAWFIERVFGHQSLATELEDLPMAYGPPNGRTLVAMVDGEVCGAGAYRRLADGTCEMKRLFVSSRHQGRGLGRRLCEAIIRAASEDGFALMRLDTGDRLREAIAMYESLGFHRCAPHLDYPPELGRHLVFMERPLPSVDRGGQQAFPIGEAER